MFRAFLTTALMAFVALPHGICFCDYLSASLPISEFFCHDHEAPTSPTDADDDHDNDCPCKLRHAMALAQTHIELEREAAGSMLLLCPENAERLTTDGSSAQLSSNRPLFQPVAPIPCALRI